MRRPGSCVFAMSKRLSSKPRARPVQRRVCRREGRNDSPCRGCAAMRATRCARRDAEAGDVVMRWIFEGERVCVDVEAARLL